MLKMTSISDIIWIKISMFIYILFFINYSHFVIYIGILCMSFCFSFTHIFFNDILSIPKPFLNLLLPHRQQILNPILIHNLSNLIDTHSIQIIKIKITTLIKYLNTFCLLSFYEEVFNFVPLLQFYSTWR